ncbi:MAG TPA: cytochrome P450 [Caulobacteraceae bacterium]|nr:cytochrome P450 [Caulobacteraceae bacterium]
MSVADVAGLPQLAGTQPPPKKGRGLLRMFGEQPSNQWETLPQSFYELPISVQKSIFGGGVFISDPDGVKRVMVDNVANYPKTEMEKRFFTAMFGEGLLGSDGETWRTHRKVMAPSFDPRSVQSYAPAMTETAAIFAQHWDQLGEGAEVDIAAEMTALTLQIICKTMFSSDSEELVDLTGAALERTQRALNFSILDILPVIGEMRMKKKTALIHADFSGMDAAIYRLIEAREKAPPGEGERKDLLSRLIAAKDPENGAKLNATEVRDEVLTIFMAGHETTAVTMTWVWYALSQMPEVAEKLHEELDRVLGGRTPMIEDIPNLPYTRMVLDETMRLYPPAPGISSRIALADDEVCGVKIKKGTAIGVAPWVQHRHERLWDDPVRFDPERFTPEKNAARPRFAYMPFGAGPRICIGAVLATTEAMLILATLAQRFTPKLSPGQDVKLQARITLRPLNGMRMILERRRAA